MPNPKLKRCPQCKISKPRNQFPKLSRAKDGLYFHCRDCSKLTWQRLNNNDKAKTYHRNRHIKNKFGLTAEDYQKLAEAQNNLCAICGKPETSTYRGKTRLLAVDHDHASGKIRDLLCSGCNIGLGKFKENQTNLQRAIEYLRKHSQ